jgi:hypothetical protein
VDDFLILMEADREQVVNLKNIRNCYCANSGQKVSDEKCSIFSVRIQM